MLIPKPVFSTVLAASKDPSRYQLCGVYLERVADRKCKAVATDGKQLTEVTWNEEDDPEDHPHGTVPVEGFSAIVPSGDMKALEKMVPRSDKAVLESVALDENPSMNGQPYHLPFVATDLDSTQKRDVRAIEATYPDYKWIVDRAPYRSGFQIRFNPYILANQLLTVAKCAGMKKNGNGTVVLAFREPIPGDKHSQPEKHPVQIWAQSEGGQIEVTGVAMPLVAQK